MCVKCLYMYACSLLFNLVRPQKVPWSPLTRATTGQNACRVTKTLKTKQIITTVFLHHTLGLNDPEMKDSSSVGCWASQQHAHWTTGTNLRRKLYVLSHCGTSCRSNLLSHPLTVYCHRPANRLVGLVVKASASRA